MIVPESPAPAWKRRELAPVAAVAGALFAFVLRDALFDPSAALVGPGAGEFAHAALRFVARSWLAGDPPWWNPHVAAGVPALGNARLGVLDPQGAPLVLAQRLGGESVATWLVAWLAWLRLVAASIGAFALARSIGLRAAGAWIAGLAFASSGFLACHAVEAAGRGAWTAPWLLLALERVRRHGGARGGPAVSVAFAAALYAGHLETALYLGLLAAVWSASMLRQDARAGRRALLALALGAALSAPVLAPAFEYLVRSSVAAARAARSQSPTLLDLGALSLVVGALWRVRELGARLGDDGRSEQRFAAGAALVLVLLALGVAALAPWPQTLTRALLPDLYGRPGGADGREWGAGPFVDAACAWMAPLVLILAGAGLLTPELGPVRNARLLRIGAALGLLLTLGAPGAVQLLQLAPFTELSDPRQVGAVAALLVALLAGAAFEHATTWARATAASCAALGVGALAFLASRDAPPPMPSVELDSPDGIVELTRAPSEALAWGEAPFEGWFQASLDVESAALRVVPLSSQAQSGHGLPLPLELSSAVWRDGDAKLAPSDARWFRAPRLLVRDLSDGAWSFVLVLRGAGGRELAQRTLAAALVHRPRQVTLASLALLFASAFAVYGLRPAREASSLPWWIPTAAGVALVALAALQFQRGLHATRPGAELFGDAGELARLGELAGDGRVMGDASVLAPHASLGLGLRDAGAGDGLGVASFDASRPLALHHGVHPVLGWSASGVDRSSPLFRLLDVRVLARAGALDDPDWPEASSDPAAPGLARLHRAASPLGVATCVARTAHPDLIARHPRDFDPAREAYLSGAVGWAATRPFTRSAVALVARTNHAVALRAELDGQGLLVLSEQLFPGWSVRVDGRPARLLGVDTLFMGVALEPGEHEIEFRYRPRGLRVGAFVALLALGALFALRLRARAPTSA